MKENTTVPKRGGLEPAVVGALSVPGLKDLATDYAQLGLDDFMDTQLLSEIPAVKTIVGIIHAGVAIRNRLFARKRFEFLGGFRGVSEWNRRDMASRLEADPKYGRYVGEHLTELLDRIESFQKAEDGCARV